MAVLQSARTSIRPAVAKDNECRGGLTVVSEPRERVLLQTSRHVIVAQGAETLTTASWG